MSQSIKNYSVIINGAGIVGLSLASALRRTGMQIALINRDPLLSSPATQAHYHNRVSAITLASQQIFTHLGVWQAISKAGISPFRAMQIWDAAGEGELHFDSARLGEPHLGHIIENSVMTTSLYQQLQQQPSIDFYCPASLEACTVETDCIRVTLDNGQTLQSKLLIGADGARSRVRTLANIPCHSESYQQTAIVCNVTTEHSHQTTAWQRFMPTGPLAFLPLKDSHVSSIVWSADTNRAQHLMSLDPPAFNSALAQAFDHRLGNITHSSQRSQFPLHGLHAQQYLSKRVVLIGDAAHVMHPLAGQGVNYGLLDAACLAEILVKQLLRGADIGSRASLRPYERWRRGDNAAMLSLVRLLKKLFGSEHPRLAQIRNWGFTKIDSLHPLKNVMMRTAMGLKGDLPQLAQRPTNRDLPWEKGRPYTMHT